MEVKAQAKFIRTSARKMRLVADSVRGLKATQALTFLASSGKRAGYTLQKTIKQAVANAENNFHLREDDLRIKRLEVNDGPIGKRFRAVSRGIAHSIKKRTSHVLVVLEGEDKSGTKS